MTLAAGRKAFTVIFTDETKEELEDVAEALRISKGAVLRLGLHNLWLMRCRDCPTCATGQPCLAPQMHSPRQVDHAPPGSLRAHNHSEA